MQCISTEINCTFRRGTEFRSCEGYVDRIMFIFITKLLGFVFGEEKNNAMLGKKVFRKADSSSFLSSLNYRRPALDK